MRLGGHLGVDHLLACRGLDDLGHDGRHLRLRGRELDRDLDSLQGGLTPGPAHRDLDRHQLLDRSRHLDYLRPRGRRPHQRLLAGRKSHQLLLLLLLSPQSSQGHGGSHGWSGLAENLAGGGGQAQLDIAGVEGGKSWSRGGLTSSHLLLGRHLDQTVGSRL